MVQRSTPKYRDLIYDVGLHLGEDTEFYLKKGFRVVAFEANPDLVREARARFRDSIARGMLTIVEGAIVDRGVIASGRRSVSFFRSESGTAWGTVQDEWAERNARLGTASERIAVGVVDFEAVLRQHGVPHYMKIDIEGCDTVCLESLQRFNHRPDYLSLESSKTSFSAVKYEIDLLTSLGYERFQAVEQTSIGGTRPPQPPREGNDVVHLFEAGSSGVFGADLLGRWKSRRAILSQYIPIRAGYRLLGDDGILYTWQFRGASRLRRATKWLLERLTGAAVPGWYDTHARLAPASTEPSPRREITMPVTAVKE